MYESSIGTYYYLDRRLHKQVRETITIIWMNDNVVLNTLWFKQGSISGVVEKCLDSGSTFNMEMTGHANKLNEGHA